MRKTLLILAGVVLLYTADYSKKSTAEGPLPASLQKVIAADTNCFCNPYLKKYTWRNQVVYLQGAAGATCDWYPLYYNAAGEPLKMAVGYQVDDFWAEAQLIKIVYSCSQ